MTMPIAPSKRRGSGGSTDAPLGNNGSAPASRQTSLTRAADAAQINDYAPIILFIGGPGGGKTRYAARLRDEMSARGLVHVCMPELVERAVARYRDTTAEWKLAAERYQRGELIPNNLAQSLVKAEMGRHPRAAAYLLEGFPREARQVEDFERNVRPINMAMILDYDENALRSHMQARGLSREVIDRRIREFTHKTLPSARYFDDQRILHLIPGEKSSNVIFERMRKLVTRAMDAGVDVQTTTSAMSATPPPSAPAAVSGETSPPATKNKESEKAKVESTAPTPLTTPPVISTPKLQPLTPTSTTASVANNVAATTVAESNPLAAVSKKPPAPLAAAFYAQMRANLNSNGSTKSDATAQRNRPTVGGQRPPSGESTRSATSATIAALMPVARDMAAATVADTTAAQLEEQQQAQVGALSPPLVKPTLPAEHDPTVQAGMKPAVEINGDEHEEKSLLDLPVESKVAEPALIEDMVPHLAEEDKSEEKPLEEPYDAFPKELLANSPVILIVGAPGSNKSEMAVRVARKYDGFAHLSMGTLFRRRVADSPADELWARVDRKINAGEIIPMKICRELLYGELRELAPTHWGFVLEGYPRTLPQAEDLEAQLGRLDVAILIDCTEQYCRDTLRSRQLLAADDGAAARGDEDAGAVRQRLAAFKQNTLPMLKYLDDKGKLRVIEGDTNLDNVFQEIVDAIDGALSAEASAARSSSAKSPAASEPPDDD